MVGSITHIITYSVHNVLSWGTDIQGMISEPNVICKVCADLALFGGEKNSVTHEKATQTRTHRWNSND